MAKTKLYTFYMGLHAVLQGTCSKWCLWQLHAKLAAHEESEIWTTLSHSFTKGGLLAVFRLVEFVQFLCK